MNGLEFFGSLCFLGAAVSRVVTRWDCEPRGRWLWLAMLVIIFAATVTELYEYAHGKALHKHHTRHLS